MNWDSQIQVGRGPPDIGGALANAGRVRARRSAPVVQGRQESDQDQLQNAGHFVRAGHRPRPAVRAPLPVIRRAESGGASAERWKETYCMSASERFATDPYPAAAHTPESTFSAAWRATRVVL